MPIGALSNQVGTLVKLVRVLMLGPVVLLLSLVASRMREEADEPAPAVTAGERPAPGRIVTSRSFTSCSSRFLMAPPSG